MQEHNDHAAAPAEVTSHWSEGSPPAAPFTGVALLEAVESARARIIVPMLRAAGLAGWADDVAGEVSESAWKSREKFDPSRGRLQGWVNQIANWRTIDRINHEQGRNGDLLPEVPAGLSVEEQLERAEEATHGREVADIAEAVVEKLAVAEWLRPVMAATAGVMDPTIFMHGLLTHIRYDGDIQTAAKAFGVSEARCREHKRLMELHAQVILRAWKTRQELAGQAATIRDLVDCLPEPGVAGSWTRQMAEALMQWRGPLSEVKAEDVQELTGWSFDTARQYLSITKTLLQVALGVMTAPESEDETHAHS